MRRSIAASDCSPRSRVAAQASWCIACQSSPYASSWSATRAHPGLTAGPPRVLTNPSRVARRPGSQIPSSAVWAPWQGSGACCWVAASDPIESTPSAANDRIRRRRSRRAGSIASSSASIVGQRSAGSRASPRNTALRIHAGTFADSRGPASIASSSAAVERPAKGRTCVMTSHSDTQKLNWSERASARA